MHGLDKPGVFPTVSDFTAEHGVTLAGGTLANATLTLGAGASLVATNSPGGNRLVGVTVNGDLDLTGAFSTLRVQDLTLNGTARLADRSAMGFEGTQTLAGQATLEFADASQANYLEMYTAGTLTLGTDVVVHGGYGIIGGAFRFGAPMTLVNQGTIRADIGGRYIQLGASGRLVSLTNEGTLEATTGATLNLINLAPNVGSLNASSGGVINVSGDLINTSAGEVNLSIGGTGSNQFGRIAVTGTATLDGNLNVKLANGFLPTAGQTFSIMTYGSRAGSFALILDQDPGDGVTYAASYNPMSVTLNVIAG